MEPDFVEIYLYFPEKSPRLENKQRLVGLIAKSMRKDGTIRCAGYASERSLKRDLLRYVGDYKTNLHRNLSTEEKRTIKETIHEAVKRCNKILPLPTKNLIFVFPWFPSKGMELFQGSLGYAPYSGCALHVFIAPGIFTRKSLANSIAHEMSHVIWSYYHPKKSSKWSLLDHIVNEGIAENFRENVLPTKSAPWAVALTKTEAFRALASMKPRLHSGDDAVRQKIFFGDGKRYRRWTGYSVGYWLVKEFQKRNKNLSWEEIVKTEPRGILDSVMKMKKK